MNPVQLAELFDLDENDFRRRFRKTPLWRPHRRGLLRNAAIVLGNQRRQAAMPALVKGLNDEETVVRGACAWALGQIGGEAARAALASQLRAEIDPDVLSEIRNALAAVDPETENSRMDALMSRSTPP
jgi:epoxyqueuosine reductase